jgi:acetylornithine deacetylase
MKSFIALAMAAVPHLLERPARRPVHFAFSYDEEVGCLGAPDLIRSILEQGYVPIAAIVGEPTNMTVVNSHKGFDLYRVTITGREAHSSLVNSGVSANMVAADLLTVLAQIAREEERSHRDERFDPQWSTLTVGTIHGGTAPNILARECRFVFDLRCIPGREPEAVLAPFREAVARIGTRIETAGEGAGILLTRLAAIPSLRQETDGAAEPLSAMLTGIDGAGTAVPYSAEAGQFQQAGLSTVLCGPGSIAQAHRADEFIELRQIEAGARFIGRLVEFVQ